MLHHLRKSETGKKVAFYIQTYSNTIGLLLEGCPLILQGCRFFIRNAAVLVLSWRKTATMAAGTASFKGPCRAIEPHWTELVWCLISLCSSQTWRIRTIIWQIPSGKHTKNYLTMVISIIMLVYQRVNMEENLKEIKHQTEIPKYHYHHRWPGSMAAAALASPRTLPAARSDVHASALFGLHHRWPRFEWLPDLIPQVFHGFTISMLVYLEGKSPCQVVDFPHFMDCDGLSWIFHILWGNPHVPPVSPCQGSHPNRSGAPVLPQQMRPQRCQQLWTQGFTRLWRLVMIRAFVL